MLLLKQMHALNRTVGIYWGKRISVGAKGMKCYKLIYFYLLLEVISLT